MTDDRIDWDALTDEATELLSDYLRVDTVNPPGNESRACEWYAQILEREGIPYRLYDPGENRASLVASLPGDGSRGRPLMLLNHTDVVPFEREHWSVDPLGGEVRDGYVWGRGASDMKGMGIMELIVFLLHRRLDLPLSRELRFAAVADEEAGSVYGVEFLAREHPDVLDCEYAINEGGRGFTRMFGQDRPVMQIGVAEKRPYWLRLTAHGEPGHGSVPRADNAADRLVRALQRIQSWERPLDPGPEVYRYFEALHEAGLVQEPPTAESLARAAESSPRIRALQTNTISLTTMESGVKHNVIPATASATLDCRLLPAYEPEQFLAELRTLIDDDGIEIEEILRSTGPPAPLDSELFAVMSRAVRDAIEDVVVVPWTGTGFTDSRVLRRVGVAAYGFVPILAEPEDAWRGHGNDERISIANLRLGMQILFDTVRGICA